MPSSPGACMVLVMHMLPRTLLHYFHYGRRGPRIPIDGVSVSSFRVWPTDLDILRHMNNGKYLSIMDIGRFNLMQAAGLIDVFRAEEWYPVVVGQTISYRKSLNPWMKFDIESRILGFDDQAVFIEQRFVRPDAQGSPEVYARAIVRGRILRRSGGVVPVAELIDKTGAGSAEFLVPEDILAWGQATRLPSTRAHAPSIW
ncbi:thioesterase family protein [Leucobacter sp. W1153]